MKHAVFNWSSGKDSSYALLKVLEESEYRIAYLLTSVNERYRRVSMHGTRELLLERQALSIGIPLKKLIVPEMPSMEDYDRVMKQTMTQLRDEGIDYSIFGDIFLEDLRTYRENQLERVGMQAVFPLWKLPTQELAKAIIDKGFKAVVVCVDGNCLDASFGGRVLDHNFLSDLPPGVDPCGENGEFHTFVYDGPIFSEPVRFTKGEVVYRTYDNSGTKHGFYYCDLIPAG